MRRPTPNERSELPTQFAPYAARSAGNQYGSVAETGCHLLLFHVYFVAAEQVLYLDFPNTGHELCRRSPRLREELSASGHDAFRSNV